MKKILFFINTLNGGGAEKVLVDTVNSLDSGKYQITVQTVFDGGINKKYLSPNIRYKSIIKTNNRIIRKILSKIIFNLLGCSFTYKLFIDDQYDYEISFLEGLSTKLISKSSNPKSKKYAWVHIDLNAYPDSYKAYGSEKKEEKAYESFDKIFCVSDYVKKAFLKKYKIDSSKLYVLYNVIDDEMINLSSKKTVELPVQTKPLFISVGRLSKVKGYERLLKIHKQLIDEGFAHAIMIIGEGKEREVLSNYIDDNNLQDSVFLLGYKENPYKYISKADLFICSSYAEGYSTVVSEAVICGVPVLSTDVSGACEPYDCPRCSIVVENNDLAIYTALRELLEKPDRLITLKKELERKKEVLKKEHLVAIFENEVFEIPN